MNSGIRTIIGVSVPFAVAVVLGTMCYSQYQARQMAQLDEAQQQKNVNSLQYELDTYKVEPLTSKHISAEATADEQAAFLTQLRLDAQGAGVKLTQYLNMGQVLPPRNDGKDFAPPNQNRPVASTLTVQGPYDGVRAFAYSLLRAPRLMNMQGVTWKRDVTADTTTLSFTLIRYVKNPVTTVQTTRVAMANAGSSGGA